MTRKGTVCCDRDGRSALLLLLLATLARSSQAREWRDVVDPALYEWMDLDAQKLIVMTETDPFQVSFSPTNSPTDFPQVEVVERPTTPLPTTIAPTEVWGMVEQNGGCDEGHVLHEIRMTDTWGDGWGEIFMTITRLVDENNLPGVVQMVETEYDTTVSEIVEVRDPLENDPSYPHQVFKGRLSEGSEGFAYVCLERNQCYEVSVEEGFWDQEIAWGIREAELGVSPKNSPDSIDYVKGEAPETCHFSVADVSSGVHACPVTCGNRTQKPTATAPIPTSSPTNAPTVIRNILPNGDTPTVSAVPSDMPSLVPTSREHAGIDTIGDADSQGDSQGAASAGYVSEVPSDAPSLVPTGPPTEERSGNTAGGGGGGGGFGFSGGFGGGF